MDGVQNMRRCAAVWSAATDWSGTLAAIWFAIFTRVAVLMLGSLPLHEDAPARR
jgi:hypothetical protein